VTGLIGESLEDLVRGVEAVGRIDRRACRARVEAHFSVERMADRYEALYRRLIRHVGGRAAA